MRLAHLLAIALLLAGCAGKVNAPKVWSQNPKVTGAAEWDYGLSTLLLGEVIGADNSWSAYGCNSARGTFTTLAQAKAFVESSCSQVNQ